jgi:hypothetical protein
MHDAAIQAFATEHRAADLVWLKQTRNTSSSDSQNDKKSLAIQASDALFARYGRE